MFLTGKLSKIDYTVAFATLLDQSSALDSEFQIFSRACKGSIGLQLRDDREKEGVAHWSKIQMGYISIIPQFYFSLQTTLNLVFQRMYFK